MTACAVSTTDTSSTRHWPILHLLALHWPVLLPILLLPVVLSCGVPADAQPTPPTNVTLLAQGQTWELQRVDDPETGRTCYLAVGIRSVAIDCRSSGEVAR